MQSEVSILLEPSQWPGPAFAAHWGRPEPWRALGHRQRLRVLCLAASSHHASSLEAALAYSGVGLTRAVLEAAAGAGDLAAFQRLLAEGCEADSNMNSATVLAARHGQLHVLQWVYHDSDPRLCLRQMFRWSRDALAVAACAGGRRHVLTWLECGMPPQAAPIAPTAPGVAAAPEQRVQQLQSAAPAERDSALMAGRSAARCQELFDRMVKAAAEGGHAAILAHLLEGRPYAAYVTVWDQRKIWAVLEEVAGGASSAPMLQRCYERWAWQLGRTAGTRERASLLTAVMRGLGDWRGKADFLLARWAGAGAGAGVSAGAGQQAAAGQRPLTSSTRLVAQEVARSMVARAQEVACSWRVAARHADFLDRWLYIGLEAGGMPATWCTLTAYVTAGCGNVAALRGLLDRWSHMCRGVPPLRAVVELAAQAGHVGVLELLLQRYGRGVLRHLTLTQVHDAAREPQGLAALPRLLELWEQGAPEALAAEAGGQEREPEHERQLQANADAEEEEEMGEEEEMEMWDRIMRHVAVAGADVSLLQQLYDVYGAAVQLDDVAEGGSEEALAWAVETLRQEAEDEQVPVVKLNRFWNLVMGGNLAAAAWLWDAGLVAATPAVPAQAGAAGAPSSRTLPHPAEYFAKLRKPGSARASSSAVGAAAYADGGGTFSVGTDKLVNCVRLWAARRRQQCGSAVATAAGGVAATAMHPHEGAAADSDVDIGGGREAAAAVAAAHFAAAALGSAGGQPREQRAGCSKGATAAAEDWRRLMSLAYAHDPELPPHQWLWLWRLEAEERAAVQASGGTA
ncbi:hypothetical protein HYH02_014899 [Chlamydomonas schloesseri]|uniref:Uncharacterized protein n=1 Tax=Chlamydomonas schloesseri TaxID=2026947 RepID=A0A835SLX2_9CHLO|nr:hypothetical protein HYH02_014899 [Chlamydomonas schloesseri]|eukprot:KAG2425898.1 hypothetical protein HYH02_014899 [Chlamydomonas schloesseri]